MKPEVSCGRTTALTAITQNIYDPDVQAGEGTLEISSCGFAILAKEGKRKGTHLEKFSK